MTAAPTIEPLFVSLGCRLNGAEAETAKSYAAKAGLDNSIIINTCAVTAEAVRHSAQAVRRAKRDHPDRQVIVTGCAAQLEPERFRRIAGVDHVIGNAEKALSETFATLAQSGTALSLVGDIASVHSISLPDVPPERARTRAHVAIQNGCDHRCTFCIIPFARGPSRSVPAGEVVRHIQTLVDQGTCEVVLTGVDLTSYGSDLPGEMSLGRLVKHVLKRVPDLPRLRLSSIDQVEADRHLLDCLASSERLMPHLHLSMQAGDNLVLKRMKRRHSREDAIRFCQDARAVRPDVVFGADLIAGFPTETDDMFRNTLACIEACGLTFIHVFPFSARTGTPAARMPQLPGELVAGRARSIRQFAARRLETFLQSHIGTTTEVLMEKNGIGRTRQFAEVALISPPPAGSVVHAKVYSHDGRRLQGEVAA